MSGTTITVFGSARSLPGSPEYSLAEQLGRLIAQAGWTVCNGGYGGTMEAAAKGAHAAGGQAIGVTCSIFDGRGSANPYITQEIPTPDLPARLDALVRLGHAYVVLPGGTGTLLELALVWELLSKRLVADLRPVILVGGHWLPVLQPISKAQPDAFELQTAADAPGVISLLTAALPHNPTRA